jgi:hypothetical protein
VMKPPTWRALDSLPISRLPKPLQSIAAAVYGIVSALYAYCVSYV